MSKQYTVIARLVVQGGDENEVQAGAQAALDNLVGGDIQDASVDSVDELHAPAATDPLSDLAWLLDHGYHVGVRDTMLLNTIAPGLGNRAEAGDASYMVYDPSDGVEGYLLTGDDLPSLLPSLLAEARRACDVPETGTLTKEDL